MNHYVYQLTDSENNYYIGVRSCICRPEDDPYMGSGSWPVLCKENKIKLKKTIIAVFETREEAAAEEAKILSFHQESDKCKNIVCSKQNHNLGPRDNTCEISRIFKLITLSEYWATSSKSKIAYIQLMSVEDYSPIHYSYVARICGFSNEEAIESLVELSEISCPLGPSILFDGKHAQREESPSLWVKKTGRKNK